MSKPLRPKRGTTAENDAFTGLPYEVTLDTDTHRLRTHDGVTAGGYEHALKSDIPGVMTGATDSAPGTSGRVPVPAAGKQDKPLTGGGQYADFIDCVVTALKDPSGNIDAAKLKQMLEAFLPLAGGTMTGNIAFSNGSIIATVPSNIVINSGINGGYIVCYNGADGDQPGVTEIVSKGDDNVFKHVIKATRDGCLADDKHIVRSVNGVGAGADGNVTLTISSGVTYANAVYDKVTESGQAYVRAKTPNYGTLWGVFGSYKAKGADAVSISPNKVGPNTVIGKAKYGRLPIDWDKVVCLRLA